MVSSRMYIFCVQEEITGKKNRSSNVEITNVFDLQNKMPQIAMVVDELNTDALQTANPISERANKNVQKGR